MKKIFYILGSLALLVSIYFVVKPVPENVEVMVLKKGLFVETLTAEGKVRSLDRHTVYAFADGSVAAIEMKVGDPVTKGQVLTQLDWDKSQPVKSPIDGVITKIYRDSAGPVLRGAPLFEVSSIKDLEVVAELLTPDAVRLSEGGLAQIQNWGGEGALEAKISRISKAGVTKTSALGVEEERAEVRLSLAKLPAELQARLGDNYHVDIIFRVSQDLDVVTLPLGALYKNGDRWAVFVVQNDRAKMNEVSVSKRNDRSAIVTAGLQEGDVVILFPGDKIREGSLVKIKSAF